jgi:tRNA threonylcarbamoyladenosine biosynthesis protein TsaB
MMKLLAIDSSGMPASVAVMEDGILLAEYTVNFRRTHSQTLMPMLEEVRRALDLNLDSLDAIAVAGGPGSFTGLRIGSATAKGIGLALNKPIIHVPTLEAMAYSYYGSDGLIVPMMDARRNQVFAGIYSFRFCRSEDSLLSCRRENQDLVFEIRT